MNLSAIHLQDADEIEAFYLETTGMKPGYIQLSAGQAGLDMQVCVLAGVSLIWTRGEGRIRWRDQMTGDGLHIGFALESEGRILARGHDVGRYDGQVWMREEQMDVVMHGPYVSLDIGVDQDLVEQLGWELAGGPLRQLNAPALDQLVRTCSDISRGLRKQSELELRDCVLEQLEPVLVPWRSPEHEPGLCRKPDPAAWRLLQAADQVLHELGPAERWAIDDLAGSLGVSRRTLFQAYRSLLGVGPKRYFEILRLNALRQSLKRTEAKSNTITKIAGEFGFSDMGRLAARYRHQFGENPSATLKRA